MQIISMCTSIDGMNKYLLTTIALLAIGSMQSYAIAPDTSTVCVSLQVKNIRQTKGTFTVSFYRSQKEFLQKGREAHIRHIHINGGSVQNIEICNVQPGAYAVAVLQDLDSDGDMKMSAVGTPREPFGFSNDIKPHLKAPSFAQCSFTLPQGASTTVSITMINP